MTWDGPVLDNHLHLAPERGRGVEAAREFARAGGTHLIVLNTPTWHHGIAVESGADFAPVFERTLETVAAVDDVLPGRAWAVLGVHPGLVSRLVDRGDDPDRAGALLRAGLEQAATHLGDDRVLGLKSGRPHYPVDDPVWAASNRAIRRALELAAAHGGAVQLHTESTTDLSAVAEWAAAVDLPAHRVVKHYAGGTLAGPVPSVLAERDRIAEAVERTDPFLLETDYLDDPERPGAVLGPKTVPRRTRWLAEAGHHGALETAHVETPELVYGVDTVGTLEG